MLGMSITSIYSLITITINVCCFQITDNDRSECISSERGFDCPTKCNGTWKVYVFKTGDWEKDSTLCVTKQGD